MHPASFLLVISNLAVAYPIFYAITIRAKCALLFTAICSAMSHAHEDGTHRAYFKQKWIFWNVCDMLGCAWITFIMILNACDCDYDGFVPGPLLMTTALSFGMGLLSVRLRNASHFEEYAITHIFWHISIYVLLCDWFQLLSL